MRPPRPLPTITMAHQPRFPVLVFVFLVVLVFPASHAAPLPPTYDASMCSESSRCGSVDIHYPFYLASATRAAADITTTYSCGYTDLRIFCQNYGEAETATIQLGQYNYTVKDISYDADAGTIILADPDAFRSGGNDGCPIIRHNVTFGQEWLHYTVAQDNLTFFFSCYLTEDVPLEFGEYRIGCLEFSNSPGGGAAYMFSSEELDAPREHDDLAEHCHEIVIVPILRDSLRGMSNRSLLRSRYGRLLREGFELAWSGATVGECYRCEESGGRCAYSQNKVFLACLCSDHKVEAQYCSNSGAGSTTSRPSKSSRN